MYLNPFPGRRFSLAYAPAALPSGPSAKSQTILVENKEKQVTAYVIIRCIHGIVTSSRETVPVDISDHPLHLAEDLNSYRLDLEVP